MLNWETVDPEAVYPSRRYVAHSDNRSYSILAHDSGQWELRITDARRLDGDGDVKGRGQVDSGGKQHSTLDDAKRAAEEWERRAASPT